MKACRNVQEIMSAYLDGEVSPDEERMVREHVASCSECKVVLQDLQKTAQLVKGLDEVEPPPWLTQKIMAHVRDEAEKAGFFKRIFYPFRIKVPIQAFATLLIVVVVFYVYKSNEPQYERVRMPVKTEQGVSQEAPPPPPPAGSAVDTSRSAGSATRAPRSAAPAATPAAPPSAVDGRSAATPAPVPAPPPGSESAGQARQEADRAFVLRSAEKAEADRQTIAKHKEVQTAEVPARAQASRAPALAPPVLKGTAVKEGTPVNVTLTVVDVKAAAREVEEVLRQNGAWNVARESHNGSESVTAELQREKAAPVVEKLDEIGDPQPLRPSLPSGNIAIRIKVVPEAE